MPNLQTQFSCGEKFDLKHAISCQKRGFVIICHNKSRHITGELLEQFGHNAAIEQILEPFTDRSLVSSRASTRDGARSEVSARTC